MIIGLLKMPKIAYFSPFWLVLIQSNKKAGTKQLFKCFTPTIDIEPKFLMYSVSFS